MAGTTPSAAAPFHFHRDNASEWSHPDFWKGLLPKLTISHKEEETTGKASSSTESLVTTDNERRCRLAEDGYALVDDNNNDRLVSLLREGILSLYRRGVSPSFILLYDEAW